MPSTDPAHSAFPPARPTAGRLAGLLLWSIAVGLAAAGLIALNVSNIRGAGQPGPLAIAGAIVDGTIALIAAILGIVAWFTALLLRRLPRARKLMVWAGWLLAGGILLFLALRLVVGLTAAG